MATAYVQTSNDKICVMKQGTGVSTATPHQTPEKDLFIKFY